MPRPLPSASEAPKRHVREVPNGQSGPHGRLPGQGPDRVPGDGRGTSSVCFRLWALGTRGVGRRLRAVLTHAHCSACTLQFGIKLETKPVTDPGAPTTRCDFAAVQAQGEASDG